MPRGSCSVCHRTWRKENIKLYHVPQNERMRKLWSESCGVNFTASSKVCALHFSPHDFNTNGPNEKRQRLDRDAVPMQIECLAAWDEPQQPFGTNNRSAQTEPYIESVVQSENMRLRSEIKRLQLENAKLKCQVEELSTLEASAATIFTEGQIKKLKHPSPKSHWSQKDIAAAISLHCAGATAYNYLYQKGFPLPSKSTISKWVQKLQFHEGILHDIIDIMKKSTDVPLTDRLCVLAFTKIKVASVYEHDPLTNCITKPNKYVLLVVARGLKSTWKQPVYYAFDYKITREMLEKLIAKLYEAGWPVLAVVSDMDINNQILWKELDISMEKTWFQSASTMNEKVFVFADAPQLLKLFRSHFIDTGFMIDDKLIAAQTIKQAMNTTSTTCKLKQDHLIVHHRGRHEVKFAAQLFSQSTAAAIRHGFASGVDVKNALETAEFIQQVNDWFDVFNSKLINAQRNSLQQPFGMDLKAQQAVLESMTKLVEKMKVPNRKSLLPFQKGVLLSICSLKGLWAYVHEKYGFECIPTYHLNKEIVEHFFSALGSKDSHFDNPSPMHFKYKLRKYLLAQKTATFSTRGYAQIDDDEWHEMEEIVNENIYDFLNDTEVAIADIPEELVEDYPIKEEELDSLPENDSTMIKVEDTSEFADKHAESLEDSNGKTEKLDSLPEGVVMIKDEDMTEFI